MNLDQTSKEGYALNDSPQPKWVMAETGASVETANVGTGFHHMRTQAYSPSAKRRGREVVKGRTYRKTPCGHKGGLGAPSLNITRSVLVNGGRRSGDKPC